MSYTLYNPSARHFVGVNIKQPTRTPRYDRPSYVNPAIMLFDDRELAITFRDKHVGYLKKPVSVGSDVKQLIVKGKEKVSGRFDLYDLRNFDNDTLVNNCVSSFIVFLYVHSYSCVNGILTINCMVIDPIMEDNQHEQERVIKEQLESLWER